MLITVGATILALFPLASHGGPLWKPLCFAQIGGLAVATFITLLLVPMLYSIAVLDLRSLSGRRTRRQDGYKQLVGAKLKLAPAVLKGSGQTGA